MTIIIEGARGPFLVKGKGREVLDWHEDCFLLFKTIDDESCHQDV